MLDRQRAEFDRTPFKHIVALNLKDKIEARLAAMVACNPTRVDLYERCQQIVQAYNPRATGTPSRRSPASC
jgi:type I restriction enzyme, R subunit